MTLTEEDLEHFSDALFAGREVRSRHAALLTKLSDFDIYHQDTTAGRSQPVYSIGIVLRRMEMTDEERALVEQWLALESL